MVRDVGKYLHGREAEATDPNIAKEWSKLDELYTKRLWHQLTLKLVDFVNNPAIQSELMDLYENFIQDFEMRMNTLSLAEIIIIVTKQIKVPDEAIAFIEKNEPKVKSNKESTALFKITKGSIKLQQNDIESVKNLLEESEAILLEMPGVSSVHGRFYLLQSEMNKKLNLTAAYYKSALKFLGCTDLENLSTQEQAEHAKHLTIAALVGQDIYNFGELLAHPILNPIRHNRDQWLVELLVAFNEGNIEKFKELRQYWSREEVLLKNEEALTTKITLLCLMEMTFKRSATDRQLTFAQISEATGLEENQVELLVMKAIAKGLVKGLIDEVARKVYMTWVQPRVLDRNQIGTMISRLDSWKKEIHNLETMVGQNAADILLT